MLTMNAIVSFFIWLITHSFAMAMIPLFFAISSTTVYLHRSATHGAVEFTPGWLRFFKTWLCLTTGINPQEWVPLHRKHHRHTDTQGDPHIPLIFGFWPIQLGNIFRYEEGIAQMTPEDWRIFGLNEPADPKWDWFFRDGKLGLAVGTFLMVIVCVLIWGKIGLLVGFTAAATHAVLYIFVLTSSINGLCHYPHFGGYQHSKAAHAITTFNNWIVALLTGGEGFHWSHHLHQATARFADKLWELPADWGYWFWIKGIELLGGCQIHNRDPKLKHRTVHD